MRSVIQLSLVFALVFGLVRLPLAAPRKTPLLTTSARTVVLPMSEGRALFKAGASGYWTPTKSDLRRLEADMPSSVADYYRQYFGMTRDGKKVILINGFSAAVAPEFTGGTNDWHRHAVFVMDGGTAFFTAFYNPKTRQFDGPHFNGLA